MSRLDEEFILGVFKNRRGKSAGDLEISIDINRFEKLSNEELLEVVRSLSYLTYRCYKQLNEKSIPNIFRYGE